MLLCRDIQLENIYHSHVEVFIQSCKHHHREIASDHAITDITMQQNSSGQPDPVQHDTLIYADIGPSSLNKKAKQFVTLRPDDMDDRVEYAVLNHSLQQPVITTNQDSHAGKQTSLFYTCNYF